mgnify:FL=1
MAMKRFAPVIVLLVLTASCSNAEKPAAGAAVPGAASTTADLKAGRAAAAACARCHGMDGKSTAPEIPHLAAQNPHYLVHALTAYRQKVRGSAPMQDTVGSLTDADLENVAAYYASLEPIKPTGVARSGPSKPTARPATAVAAGKAAAAACAGCHGADGNSAMAGTPHLAGQDAPYFAAAMRAYKDGSRRHAVMQGAVAALSDMDITNLAAFYAAQTPRLPKARIPLPPEEWAEKCDRCHEPAIENPVIAFPKIRGQPASYIAKALKTYQEESSRASSIMHAMAAPLTEEEISAIAEYYARQPPR